MKGRTRNTRVANAGPIMYARGFMSLYMLIRSASSSLILLKKYISAPASTKDAPTLVPNKINAQRDRDGSFMKAIDVVDAIMIIKPKVIMFVFLTWYLSISIPIGKPKITKGDSIMVKITPIWSHVKPRCSIKYIGVYTTIHAKNK